MKKLFIIILITTPILIFGQKTTAISDNSEKEKKISYSFINEYGFSIGSFFWGEFCAEMTGVFVNGIRFNKTQNEIGIGIGYEYYPSFVFNQFFPIFLNYRHYFPSNKDLKPLINIGIGIRLNVWNPRYFLWRTPHYYDCSTGLYSTIAAGFKVNAFSFTSGISIKSGGFDFNYSVGAEIKAGFTF